MGLGGLNFNPYGKTVPREDWLNNLQMPRKGEILFFGGCTYPHISPNTGSAILSELSGAGQEMACLGSEENYCGSYILRTGYHNYFKKLAEENVKNFIKTGCQTIVTPCAGCYRTLKKDYPQYVESFDFEILHVTELLAGLINSGKFKPKKRLI